MKITPKKILGLPKRIRNIQQILKNSNSSLCYLGWVGGANLGDQALFNVIQSYLEPEILFHYVPSMNEIKALQLINKKRRVFKAVCLGGGTLIGRRIYLDMLKGFMASESKFFSFGSGVQDPLFWEQYLGHKLNLIEWKDVLSRFIDISVRGPNSIRILKDYDITNAVLIGDPCLGFSPDRIPNHADKMVLGVNIGGISTGEYWGRSYSKLIKIIVTGLKRVAEDGWMFRFFSVFPPDDIVHKEIISSIGAESVLQNTIYNDAHTFVSDVSECSAFMGTKLHSTILAYASYVPVISLEYRPKCRDFMESVNRQGYNIRTDMLSSEWLIEMIGRTMQKRELLVQDQYETCKRYKEILRDFSKTIISKINS